MNISIYILNEISYKIAKLKNNIKIFIIAKKKDKYFHNFTELNKKILL